MRISVPFRLSHPRRDEPLTAEEHARLEAKHRDRLASEYGISAEMVSYALGQGWDVEDYASAANARTVTDWTHGRQKLAERREARAEAERQLEIERAKSELRSTK